MGRKRKSKDQPAPENASDAPTGDGQSQPDPTEDATAPAATGDQSPDETSGDGEANDAKTDSAAKDGAKAKDGHAVVLAGGGASADLLADGKVVGAITAEKNCEPSEVMHALRNGRHAEVVETAKGLAVVVTAKAIAFGNGTRKAGHVLGSVKPAKKITLDEMLAALATRPSVKHTN